MHYDSRVINNNHREIVRLISAIYQKNIFIENIVHLTKNSKFERKVQKFSKYLIIPRKVAKNI